MVNVLILSCGTRNKIVRYFKENLELKGKVICTDCSELAPALYDADGYYIVPRIDDPSYMDQILEICRKENITGVLSLIDPELSLLAENIDRFREIGVSVIGSEYGICELTLDKYDMYNWLTAHGYKCAKRYGNVHEFLSAGMRGEISYPVFVKPRRGSASISISKVYDDKMLNAVMGSQQDLIIQEFLDGQEIGADVYVDMISGEISSIFTKKKLKMRAGETDKAVSFRDSELFQLIVRFIKELGCSGPVDIDIFEIDGAYYISEVNPRFGGGYPHAYACGVNNILSICNNLSGIPNTVEIGEYESDVYMMKYNDIMIKK